MRLRARLPWACWPTADRLRARPPACPRAAGAVARRALDMLPSSVLGRWPAGGGRCYRYAPHIATMIRAARGGRSAQRARSERDRIVEGRRIIRRVGGGRVGLGERRHDRAQIPALEVVHERRSGLLLGNQASDFLQ